jgi:Na+/H+-dicarboxylate symporter
MSNLVKILVAIVVVAIVAVLVSKNAQTATVLKNVGDAFAKIIKTAVGPVT